MLRPPGPLCDRPNMLIVVRNVAKDVRPASRDAECQEMLADSARVGQAKEGRYRYIVKNLLHPSLGQTKEVVRPINMEEEDEDDIYASVGGNAPSTQPRPDNSTTTNAGDTHDQDGSAEDEEEGEEVEEEESDSVGAKVGRHPDISLINLPLGHRHYH